MPHLGFTLRSSEGGDTLRGGLPLRGGEVVGPSIGFTPMYRPSIGQVHHVFEADGQSRSIDILDSWEAIDEAPGGWISASGRALSSQILDSAFISDGARWITYLYDGTEVFGGNLAGDPPISSLGDVDSIVQLVAAGYSHLIEDEIDRYLVKNQFPGDWVDASNPPFNYTFNLNKAISVATDLGKITFDVPVSTLMATNDNNGAAFWPQGDQPHRIAFHISANRTATFAILVDTSLGPDHSRTQRASFSLFSVTDQDVDVDLSDIGDNDLVTIVLNYTGTGGTLGAELKVTITNLSVWGRVTSDTVSANNLAAVIAGDSGIFLGSAQVPIQDVAPIDIKSGTRADALTQACLLTDTRYLIRGGRRPVMEIGPWGPQYRSVNPEQAVTLQPVLPYDRVRVPFYYPDGATIGYAIGFAPERLRISRTYTVSMPQPMVDDETAGTFATVLAAYLGVPHWTGDGTFLQVDDGSLSVVSAHKIRAGGMMYFGGKQLRITQVRHTAGGVQVQFEDRLAVLNKLIALQARNNAARGFVAAGSFSGV